MPSSPPGAHPPKVPVRAVNAVTIPAENGAPKYLAVLLHGVGADADSFQDIARALGHGLPSVEFLVPDGFHPFDGGGAGRQWFSLRGVNDANRPQRIREAAGEVSEWIDGELEKRGLAKDRLVVLGFSQGAMVASSLAIHSSPLPAAVVMLSGRVAEDRAAVPGASGAPVFIAHGDRDPVVDVSNAAPAAEVLSAWGARVTKRIYPGLGHQVDARELRDVLGFLQSTLDAR